MATQIARWGNSLALRIPKNVAEQARLEIGTEVAVTVEAGRVVVEAVRPSYQLERLVAAITDENMQGEVDWGPPMGQEAW